ncbi:MAG: hypothetical protein MK110_06545 [Fuerstiella sp.]|nr:hypothetical protein [Fuerstiella sp.]
MTAKEPNRLLKRVVLFCMTTLLIHGSGQARDWSDATGRHHWKAEFLAASSRLVVLRDRKGELQSVQISELSESDRMYVARYLDNEGSRVSRDIHTWTLKSGLKVKGQVHGYKSGPVEIENRSGVPYVNRRPFRDIDPVYQAMLPKLVAATEDESVKTVEDFKEWTKQLRGKKRSIQVDGVRMMLESGDQYAVPLFLFSDDDREVLEKGWRQWSKKEATQDQKEQEDLFIRTEASEHQRRKRPAGAGSRQIQMMQLGLLAVDAGVTSLWEVRLVPGRGVYGRPMKVIVPANDSLAAQRAAMRKHPGYVAGSSRQISRR